ncbi:MAG TPA: LysR family transcriptional regulator [Flexivirga sp.]|uniref:LysR family transcriptional regulator n=1 Tax=Flexivirga sp. TaxID=1962927 RepID=UPI002CB0EB67|nr:LysR family transcriptional regulator [Flexivirga sp.]HWC21293.1 LysR family transcriptional regulator [Flexivirga sp.]
MRSVDALRSFVAVVRTGGVSAAARTLHYDPSTVRAHIRGLERRWHVRLLHRSQRDGRNLLTGAGNKIAPQAVEAIAAIDRLDTTAATLGKKQEV